MKERCSGVNRVNMSSTENSLLCSYFDWLKKNLKLMVPINLAIYASKKKATMDSSTVDLIV